MLEVLSVLSTCTLPFFTISNVTESTPALELIPAGSFSVMACFTSVVPILYLFAPGAEVFGTP